MNLASAPAIKPKESRIVYPCFEANFPVSQTRADSTFLRRGRSAERGRCYELIDSIWAHNLLHFLEESRGEWEGFVGRDARLFKSGDCLACFGRVASNKVARLPISPLINPPPPVASVPAEEAISSFAPGSRPTKLSKL